MAGRGKSETRSVTEVDVKVNYAMYLTRVAIYRYILIILMSSKRSSSRRRRNRAKGTNCNT